MRLLFTVTELSGVSHCKNGRTRQTTLIFSSEPERFIVAARVSGIKREEVGAERRAFCGSYKNRDLRALQEKSVLSKHAYSLSFFCNE